MPTCALTRKTETRYFRSCSGFVFAKAPKYWLEKETDRQGRYRRTNTSKFNVSASRVKWRETNSNLSCLPERRLGIVSDFYRNTNMESLIQRTINARTVIWELQYLIRCAIDAVGVICGFRCDGAIQLVCHRNTLGAKNNSRQNISGWYWAYPAPNSLAHLFGSDMTYWCWKNRVPVNCIFNSPCNQCCNNDCLILQ